jgi:hypothetical protein
VVPNVERYFMFVYGLYMYSFFIFSNIVLLLHFFRMAPPWQYPLLDPEVDKDHRAHLMADDGKVSDAKIIFTLFTCFHTC